MKEKKMWYVQTVMVLFLGLLLLLPLRAISQVLTDEQKADLQQKKGEVKQKVEEQLTPEQKAKLKAKKEEAKTKKEEAKKQAEEYKNLSPEQQGALKKQKKEELKKKGEETKQKAEEYKNLSPAQQEAVKQQKKDEIRRKAEEKMTPEQRDIRRENRPIVSAAENLEDAIAYMDRAGGDFGGHKAKAIEACKKAITQLNKASAYRAKKINRD